MADGSFGLGLAAGERIGPYRILRRLGGGGMGTVYLAEAAESCPVPVGRQIAIKVLRHTQDPEDRRRFDREVRYLQSLRHPGIIGVLDAGEHNGVPWLAMPYVTGRPADALVRDRQGCPIATAIDVGVQTLEALHVAHLAGILHRDIKPGNIMLDEDGRVRVVDFGLAANPLHESRVTRTGDILGTPAYMSPEQAAGLRERIGVRSDLFSVGACLYELLTGRAPYEADNAMAVLRRIIEDPLVPPRRLRQGIPRDLELVVRIAMAKEPADRYPSAEAMAADLRLVQDGRRIRGRLPAWPVRGVRAAVRHRRLVATLGLAGFILATAGALAVRHWQHNRPEVIPDPRDWIEAGVWAPPADGGEAVMGIWSAWGEGLQLAQLRPIQGPVRLVTSIVLPPGAVSGTALELLVSDRDVGRGYRLRLELDEAKGDAAGDRLVLLREDRLMAARDLPRLPRGEVVTLRFEHADLDLVGAVEVPGRPTEVLRFLDLAPIQGASATGVAVARRPAVIVRGAALSQQRGGEFVSALVLADDRRLEGSYARAAALYEDFLREHPRSPQARDARLRLALCREALPGMSELALDDFRTIARASSADPAYALVATFHAWTCALRLNRYEDAEDLFEAIRTGYDLPTVLAAVPAETLKTVRDDYYERAQRLELSEPERAVRLYKTCAAIAGYLDQRRLDVGLTNAGDVLMGLGRPVEALETYQRMHQDERLSEAVRRGGLLKVAEAQRLIGALAAAKEAYSGVIEGDASGEQGQWARLWLGDLYCDQGRPDLAVELWREGSGHERVGLPAMIMRALIIHDALIPAVAEPWYGNDIDWFNGRIASLNGDEPGAQVWFQRVAEAVRQSDWPTPLARAKGVGR